MWNDDQDIVAFAKEGGPVICQGAASEPPLEAPAISPDQITHLILSPSGKRDDVAHGTVLTGFCLFDPRGKWFFHPGERIKSLDAAFHYPLSFTSQFVEWDR